MDKKFKRSDAKKLLERIRSRYKVMTEADHANREKALDDLRFLHEPGAQWDDKQRKARGNRPCYEFNKLRVKVARVVNDMRANRPQIKVRPTEDSDKDTADIYEGLVRNILSVSDADTTFDYAGQYQAGGGMGAWRVETKYGDESFDQEICIKPLKNPFCLFADPSCSDPIKRDAEDWIVTEKIPNKAFEEKYGKAEKIGFEDLEFDDDDQWEDDETTRVCEYWYKERYDKELWLLNDGRVVDSTKPENAELAPLVVRKRVVKCPRIMMCVASGSAILEGPTEWAGTQFPFVIVYGEMYVIDGKATWFGMTRHAKDAQREYNNSRTAIAETIALAPQAKWLATAKQLEGHIDNWNVAHRENLPVLGYNADGTAPPPQRIGGPEIPAALMQEAAMADQDLKDVTGVYDANIGAKSNESSGRAISRRAEQSDLVTFHVKDNMDKGVRRTGEIIVDLIPHIYDTERSIRVLGVDGSEKYVKVNQVVHDPATNTQKAVNDLRRGKYDTTITTGPSFTTLRQEASETYIGLAQSDPALMAVAGDLVYKSIDAPFSDEIAERRRLMLPPQIQQHLSEGKQLPPEAQAAMAQAQAAMQVVQQQSQLVQAAAQEVEQSKAESEKAKAQVQAELAKLDTKKAQLEAYVAEQMAKIAMAQAKLAEQQATAGGEQERADLNAQVTEALNGIQQMVAQWQQQATQTIADMQARTQPQVIVASPPKRKQVRVKRVNGELLGEVTEIPELVQ